jgi:hypothetical protein
MTVEEEKELRSIIDKLAIFNGYQPNEIKDYFIDFCKDSSCLYYTRGHLWVHVKGLDHYKDWSDDLYRMQNNL